MQTRDQKYAVDAYYRVEKVKEIEEKDRKSYGSMAYKLPVLIRTAGLAQALAFVVARGTPVQKQLLKDIEETIGKHTNQTLQARAHLANLSDYIHLTQQVMDALLWYKRFAQSVLDIGDAATEEDTSNG